MLRTPENELLLVVAITQPRMERTTVYNVEVDQFHTYFAGRSRAAWSHNGGADGCGIPKAATHESRGLTKAVRDDAYTASRHLRGGKEVEKSLRKGKEAHVFNDDVDLKTLEQRVWAQGQRGLQASGEPHRAEFDRFLWRSDTPIGTRIQNGKPDVPLHWVEIKGKVVNGEWVYHLVPRSKPA